MKKIVFGITGLNLGGAERVLVDLSNKLVEKYDITIFTLYGNGEFEKQLDKRVKLVSVYDRKYEEINKVRNNKICSIRKLNISSEEKRKKIDELKKLPVYKKGKGLGIGNMTSQILAIYYLNGIDHFIKEDLRVKYYIRYMDDLVFLDTDYKRLKKIFDMVKVKIENLDLELNDKSRILDFDRGFSFLGYTYKNCNGLIIRINNFTYRRVRRHLRNLKRFDSEMYERSLISYKGFFSRSNVFKGVLG